MRAFLVRLGGMCVCVHRRGRACTRVFGGEVGFEGEAVSLRAFVRAFVHVGLCACVFLHVCVFLHMCVFSMCVCVFFMCVFFLVCVCFHMCFSMCHLGCVWVGSAARARAARALGCA